MVNRGEEKVRVHMNVVPRSTVNTNDETENFKTLKCKWIFMGYYLHFRVNSLFHHLCSQCYAVQHSYVPLLSLRRDSPSIIVPDFLCANL